MPWHVITKLGMEVYFTCVQNAESCSIQKDSLQRHQKTCQSLHFKCPCCNELKQNILDLAAHWKLCHAPFCEECQQEFFGLDQLKQHKKLIPRKGKPPHLEHQKNGKRKVSFIADFACSHLQLAKNSSCIKLPTWMTRELTNQWNLISILRMKG